MNHSEILIDGSLVPPPGLTKWKWGVIDNWDLQTIGNYMYHAVTFRRHRMAPESPDRVGPIYHTVIKVPIDATTDELPKLEILPHIAFSTRNFNDNDINLEKFMDKCLEIDTTLIPTVRENFVHQLDAYISKPPLDLPLNTGNQDIGTFGSYNVIEAYNYSLSASDDTFLIRLVMFKRLRNMSDQAVFFDCACTFSTTGEPNFLLDVSKVYVGNVPDTPHCVLFELFEWVDFGQYFFITYPYYDIEKVEACLDMLCEIPNPGSSCSLHNKDCPGTYSTVDDDGQTYAVYNCSCREELSEDWNGWTAIFDQLWKYDSLNRRIFPITVGVDNVPEQIEIPHRK